MGKGYSRRSMAIELLNGEYEKMVLRIKELEKENKLLKKNQMLPLERKTAEYLLH